MLGGLEETDQMLFIIICLWKPASLIMAGDCPKELSILFIFTSQAFQQAGSHWMSPPDRRIQNYETSKFNVRAIEEWVLEGRGSRGDLGDIRGRWVGVSAVSRGLGPSLLCILSVLPNWFHFMIEKKMFSPWRSQYLLYLQPPANAI